MCLFAVIGERGMLAHFLFHDALVKKMIKALASEHLSCGQSIPYANTTTSIVMV